MEGTTASGCGLLRGAVLLKLVQNQHLKDVREFRLLRGADRNRTHALAGTRAECSKAQEADFQTQTGLSRNSKPSERSKLQCPLQAGRGNATTSAQA